MTPADVEATVKKTACEVLDIRGDEWSPELSFARDLSVDAEDVLVLMAVLEMRLGVDLGDDCGPTIASLTEHVQARVVALGAEKESL